MEIVALLIQDDNRHDTSNQTQTLIHAECSVVMETCAYLIVSFQQEKVPDPTNPLLCRHTLMMVNSEEMTQFMKGGTDINVGKNQ